MIADGSVDASGQASGQGSTARRTSDVNIDFVPPTADPEEDEVDVQLVARTFAEI